jgi:hypothetical protein
VYFPGSRLKANGTVRAAGLARGLLQEIEQIHGGQNLVGCGKNCVGCGGRLREIGGRRGHVHTDESIFLRADLNFVAIEIGLRRRQLLEGIPIEHLLGRQLRKGGLQVRNCGANAGVGLERRD